MKKIKTAIFLSGEETNFKSIYDTCLEKNCPFEIEIVISDRRCKGYDLSKSLNKKTYIFENCEKITFEKKTNMVLKQNQIDLICLAGFMKILSEDFVKKWNKKILNIHPSILPLFPGLNTYKKVIQYGMKIHGSTVHIVNSKVDSGPIIAQSAITIDDLDNEISIEKKLKKSEHYLYPIAIKKYVIKTFFKNNKNSLKIEKNKYSNIIYSI